MIYQILYGGTEKVAVLAQYEAAEDTQDPGADISLTTPDGEEPVSAGAGKMESGEVETAQPEVGAVSHQEEADQTEGDKDEDGGAAQEQPSAAPQKPAETDIPSPQDGGHQEGQESMPGEESLPEKVGFSEKETAAEQEGRILFSETQMVMTPTASSGAGALLPFAFGVLVTLGITVLLLWMRHRCPGGLCPADTRRPWIPHCQRPRVGNPGRTAGCILYYRPGDAGERRAGGGSGWYGRLGGQWSGEPKPYRRA